MLPEEVRLDLQWMARDFETLLAAAPTDRLDEPTYGTRWTNRQLLWHMAFGQHIARVLLPPMSGFAQLPASASRRYASTLSVVSRPYDRVNYAGSVAGARVTGLRLARRWMRRDTERLQGWGARATDTQLASGMSVPPEWDPYFGPWMSRYDVLVWTTKPTTTTRAQPTLDTAASPPSCPPR